MTQFAAHRLRLIFLVNFCLCIALQFGWLVYSLARGFPIREKFLLFEIGRSSPAWTFVFVGPLVLVGYFLSHADRNLAARLAAGVVGFGGLIWLLAVHYPLSVLYTDHPLIWDIATVIGLYVLLSYAALAIFWKSRG